MEWLEGRGHWAFGGDMWDPFMFFKSGRYIVKGQLCSKNTNWILVLMSVLHHFLLSIDVDRL